MTEVPTRAWLLLAVTVLVEVAATLLLRVSEGFTVWWASVLSLLGYAAAVVMLARVLQYLPMSITYVVWTGVGTTGVLSLGVVLLGDRMSPAAWVGAALVVIGVITMNLRGPAHSTS